MNTSPKSMARSSNGRTGAGFLVVLPLLSRAVTSEALSFLFGLSLRSSSLASCSGWWDQCWGVREFAPSAVTSASFTSPVALVWTTICMRQVVRKSPVDGHSLVMTLMCGLRQDQREGRSHGLDVFGQTGQEPL